MLDTRNNASLLDLAVDLLRSARGALNSGQFGQARDSCVKSIALFDLACGSNSELSDQFRACRQLVDNLAEQLSDQIAKQSIPSNQSMVSDEEAHFNEQKEENELHVDSTQPVVAGYDVVMGCEQAKTTLFENIILPLKLVDNRHRSILKGVRSGTGNVLLHGPPGTGKTLLAQATAAEAGAAFFCVHPSDVLSKYQGESERYLKSVFQQARTQDKAIIFFDEFDSIASSRGGGNDESGGGGVQARRLLSELLMQMSRSKQLQKQAVDSLSEHDEGRDGEVTESSTPVSKTTGLVVVLAATNRLEDLDEAAMRRFESKVYVGASGPATRVAMLGRYLQGLDSELGEEDLLRVAEMAKGWSGSDIEILCREAAMAPIREALPYRSFLRDNDGGGKRQRVDVTKDSRESLKVRPIALQDFVTAHTRLLFTPGEAGEEDVDA